MTHKDSRASNSANASGRRFQLLERITAFALGLVVVSLVWMVLAANGVSWVRLPARDGAVVRKLEDMGGEGNPGIKTANEQGEVIIIATLFSGALVLVSAVALSQSRE